MFRGGTTSQAQGAETGFGLEKRVSHCFCDAQGGCTHANVTGDWVANVAAPGKDNVSARFTKSKTLAEFATVSTSHQLSDSHTAVLRFQSVQDGRVVAVLGNTTHCPAAGTRRNPVYITPFAPVFTDSLCIPGTEAAPPSLVSALLVAQRASRRAQNLPPESTVVNVNASDVILTVAIWCQ